MANQKTFPRGLNIGPEAHRVLRVQIREALESRGEDAPLPETVDELRALLGRLSEGVPLLQLLGVRADLPESDLEAALCAFREDFGPEHRELFCRDTHAELGRFSRAVAVDGRFVDSWRTDPSETAKALGIDLSDTLRRRFEFAARTGLDPVIPQIGPLPIGPTPTPAPPGTLDPPQPPPPGPSGPTPTPAPPGSLPDPPSTGGPVPAPTPGPTPVPPGTDPIPDDPPGPPFGGPRPTPTPSPFPPLDPGFDPHANPVSVVITAVVIIGVAVRLDVAPDDIDVIDPRAGNRL